MIRRPPRSTQSRSSAASDVYKRQASQHSSAAPPPWALRSTQRPLGPENPAPVSYTHLRAHETRHDLVCRLLLEKKKKKKKKKKINKKNRKERIREKKRNIQK